MFMMQSVSTLPTFAIAKAEIGRLGLHLIKDQLTQWIRSMRSG